MEQPAQLSSIPPEDERLFAMLSHLLQVIGGWIAPLVIYLIKRESKFVAFHSIQVLFFQLALFALQMIAMFFFVAAIFQTIPFPSPQAGSSSGAVFPVQFFRMMRFVWLGGAAISLATLVLGIVYGIRANRGEWAEYPIFGALARRVIKP